MPNKHIAQHPRFITNFPVIISATGFGANATKAVSYTESALKGLKTDMVIVATVDGNSGVIVVGAGCSVDGRVSVVYRNNGAAGVKRGLTLTVVGL